MGQTHDEIAHRLAERLCWQVGQRDATRIVRRRSRKPLVDGVYQLATGVLLDDCIPFPQVSEVEGRGSAGPTPGDRGDGLRLERAQPDRDRDQDATDHAGGADPAA